MVLYILHGLCLEIRHEVSETEAVLDQLLLDLSCVRSRASTTKPELHLFVSAHSNGVCLPPTAREIFRAEGFHGLEHGDDFYLTDGTSLLHLRASKGQGKAYLTSAFLHKPLFLQRTFWAFGLLKLLRPRGFYSLHAAGVVTPAKLGVLVIGSSGSGKSTLTVGLVRHGWHYLSDDAVLLTLRPAGVTALAFRKYCYVDTDAVANYIDLPWEAEVPDRLGRYGRRLRLADAYPDRSTAQCVPQVLLFARIMPEARSTVRPLDRVTALRHLLAQSGPQLFDRSSMPRHLDILKRLVEQTTTYELLAGGDLHQQPSLLGELLSQAEEKHGTSGDRVNQPV
jgi:hypothetical protein